MTPQLQMYLYCFSFKSIVLTKSVCFLYPNVHARYSPIFIVCVCGGEGCIPKEESGNKNHKETTEYIVIFRLQLLIATSLPRIIVTYFNPFEVSQRIYAFFHLRKRNPQVRAIQCFCLFHCLFGGGFQINNNCNLISKL